jgi:hypothetical protein
MPIGLRNLGATCYVSCPPVGPAHRKAKLTIQANAFLQVWYHNVQFRNELYRCHLTEVRVIWAYLFSTLGSQR